MTGRLEGKMALVTGGSSGIGFATVKRFVKEGAHVYVTGRRQRELDDAVKTIGRNVSGIQADASNPNDLDRLYAQIKQDRFTRRIVIFRG
jgi:NAD(P)-dependent dehydrogenase (short-subunit alcohol dehydrogenase family)